MDHERSRERLRFEAFDHEEFPNGSGRVRVVLADRAARWIGDATGLETREGTARAAAQATLAAARQATGNGLEADVVGIKLVRAFDAWIIIAAVRARGSDRSYRLLGCSEAPGDDTARGAVLAVLDALNRVIEKYRPLDF